MLMAAPEPQRDTQQMAQPRRKAPNAVPTATNMMGHRYRMRLACAAPMVVSGQQKEHSRCRRAHGEGERRNPLPQAGSGRDRRGISPLDSNQHERGDCKRKREAFERRYCPDA